MVVHLLLIEADNARNLGGSCMRDLVNLEKYMDAFSTKNNINRGQTFILSIDNAANLSSKFVTKNAVYDKLANYKTNFQNFVSNVKNQDIVVILVSGHGYQKFSNNNEADRLDEFISFNSGAIVDDDFNLLLLKKLGNASRVFCLIDTCHAATMFDNDVNKYTNVYSLGACRDNQLDSCDIGNNTGFGGALTVHLLDIQDAMTSLLLGTNAQIQVVVNTITNIIKPLNQTPVLILPYIAPVPAKPVPAPAKPVPAPAKPVPAPAKPKVVKSVNRNFRLHN